MTARVLVVDDVEANVKLLEARLSAEYFEVRTAPNVPTLCRFVPARARTSSCST
jgi:CheY-like chemotaxis protein